MTDFASLELIEPLLRALSAQGYENPTPIQESAIPPLLRGEDVLGCAQTGTGKTAAFLLPILQRISASSLNGKRKIKGLVLTPTRELAAQINESFADYAEFVDVNAMVIFGGVNQRPQVSQLRRGVDVLIATPGRLLDLHGQGHINFNDVEFFVLDEADRMLDMGFVRDIQKIIKLLPEDRQNLLFSATMPKAIVRLASAFLNDPTMVEVDPESSTVERIRQVVMYVSRPNKKRLLISLLKEKDIESAIVFTRTKHGANKVVKDLLNSGVEAAAIHGNKSQGARTRALAGFKSGEVRVLVATDIASRGIDVDGVSHVINYDIPNIPESYVHRIGRTARAGKEGVAIAFCDETESAYLRDIERLIGEGIEVDSDHQWHFVDAINAPRQKPQKTQRNRSGQRDFRSGQRRGGGGGGGGSRRGPGGGRRHGNNSGRGGGGGDR